MDEKTSRILGDLEIVLRNYDKLRPEQRENADLAMSYRLSQLEQIDSSIARQYRSRYIKAQEGNR